MNILCNAQWKKKISPSHPSSAFIRYAHAQARGQSMLAEGRGLLFRPEGAIADIFTPENCAIVHSFLPDIRLYESLGYRVFDTVCLSDLSAELSDFGKNDLTFAAVHLSPARALNDEMIACALTLLAHRGGLLIVEGHKETGINAVLQQAQAYGYKPQSWAKFHGKAFWIAAQRFGGADKNKAPAPWPLARQPKAEGFTTCAGIFSPQHIDPGSRILGAFIAENAADIYGYGCDLGAGWGYLSYCALKNPAISHIDLIEAEKRALWAAKKNIDPDRATFHWADIREADIKDLSGAAYDFIITNPPFHMHGQKALSLGVDFIKAAQRLLKKSGALYLVANRKLPYEVPLSQAFSNVALQECAGGYKIFKATRPLIGK